jgi:hypothetical protein
MSERKEERVAAQIVDELKLQAWLARAELENPSVGEVHGEAKVLAQIRDELRLQAHLGKMELVDDFHESEKHWREFMHHAEQRAHDVGDTLRGLLGRIRERYGRHRS